MADRWVSNTKYWCKYCRIFVDENKASRAIHEGGKKHKENVAQFLRNVDKKSQAELLVEKETVKQLELIEKAAQNQYSSDVREYSLPSAPQSSFSYPQRSSQFGRPSQPPPARPKAPASAAVPEPVIIEKTAVESVTPGAWEVVETSPLPPPSASRRSKLSTESSHNRSVADESKPSGIHGGHGNGDEADDDDDENPEYLHNFKVREKTLDELEPPRKPSQEGSSTSSGFKKRKSGGAAKHRNIRTKTG
ncbi:hypothetical protein BJ085DRAFT_40666 [Dimargaris cristalligena]|uniref:Matrin-type domain-containing protein n=1 Tax=Dimargaris cristalligena TaxID=215637 RepID=A0A4P9ZS95_9FUNG|nr:hypothetical protein BJ085DRAFT_40666 [Dimargaris cristalligena]|eukprot:RKP36343.1 hypothetical protein BJ085DRAFT_40666 [Dimargaris cristalligena]